MQKWISLLLCLALFLVLAACGGGTNAPSKTSTAKGVTFSISKDALVSAKTAKTLSAATLDPMATHAAISVSDANGNAVLTDYDTPLYSLNGSYITGTVALPPGTYNLTRFLVLDNNNHVLYLVPTESADPGIKALVSTILPISFTVTADQTKTVPLQVLAPEGTDAQSFGYASMFFSIVEYAKFLSSVQTLNVATQSWALTDATLTVNGVNYSHPAKTMTVRVAQADSYTLVYSKSGYETKTITLSAADLVQYQSTPLVVTLTALPAVVYHTVTFDSTGGSAVDPQSVADKGTAHAPTPAPILSGHTFLYWYSTDPATEFDFNTSITADLLLHAKWIESGSQTYSVAGTYAFKVPAGVRAVTLTVVGADGGPGGYVYNDSTGGGGMGGGFSRVSYNGTRLREAKGGDGEHGQIGDDSPDLGIPQPGFGEDYCILGPEHKYYGPFDLQLAIVVGKGGAAGSDGYGMPNDLPPGKDGYVTISW